MTNDDLQARLATTTGPDRELDSLVARSCGWRKATGVTSDLWFTRDLVEKARKSKRGLWGMGRPEILPLFTQSMDIACTLLPSEWAINDMMIWPGLPVTLSLIETMLDRHGRHVHSAKQGHRVLKISGATPALAICSGAALIYAVRD